MIVARWEKPLVYKLVPIPKKDEFLNAWVYILDLLALLVLNVFGVCVVLVKFRNLVGCFHVAARLFSFCVLFIRDTVTSC